MTHHVYQEQFSLLLELQGIDIELHELEVHLAGLPEKLKQTEIAYHTIKDALEANQSALAMVEKSKRADETELAASLESLRQKEARLYAIKTNKEYQAAIKEVSEGKRINKEREDRVIQYMEKIEELNKKITQQKLDFADKEGVYKNELAVVQKEEVELRDKINELLTHRSELSERIDKTIYRKYEFVRRRYPQALCGVVNGVCQGCSRKIQPQLFNEMLKKDSFKYCPSCNRLIFVKEEEQKEEASKDSEISSS